MREVIISNGGEVNNYIGDAILAIFGLKELHQQTIRAIKAALQMLTKIVNFTKNAKFSEISDFSTFPKCYSFLDPDLG